MDEYKVAPLMLPSSILYDYYKKNAHLTFDGMQKYACEYPDKASFINTWFNQEGWRVGASSEHLIATNGQVVYEWRQTIPKEGVTDGTTTPYWIMDMDVLKDVDEEGTYQIRQYPFMMPSSRDNALYVDQQDDHWEHLHEIKWNS